MENLEIAEKLLRIVLSWPTVLLAAVVILRTPIKKIAERFVKSQKGSAKIGPVEIKLGDSPPDAEYENLQTEWAHLVAKGKSNKTFSHFETFRQIRSEIDPIDAFILDAIFETYLYAKEKSDILDHIRKIYSAKQFDIPRYGLSINNLERLGFIKVYDTSTLPKDDLNIVILQFKFDEKTEEHEVVNTDVKSQFGGFMFIASLTLFGDYFMQVNTGALSEDSVDGGYRTDLRMSLTFE